MTKRFAVAVKACVLGLGLFLGGCATAPPSQVENICSIFREKKDWYKEARRSEERWGVPIHVQMAILRHESGFVHDAKPPRKRFLGIPGRRLSSAYGYPQAKDSTWEWYQSKTGRWRADRDDFEDAVDFVGWYLNVSRSRLGLSLWDPYRQYLAYHEGHGGFERGTYQRKQWLLNHARKVEATAHAYGGQLQRCRREFERRGWF